MVPGAAASGAGSPVLALPGRGHLGVGVGGGRAGLCQDLGAGFGGGGRRGYNHLHLVLSLQPEIVGERGGKGGSGEMRVGEGKKERGRMTNTEYAIVCTRSTCMY